MIRLAFISVLFLIEIISASLALAQASSAFSEKGYFYIQNFDQKEYKGHAQNWAITQSDEGLIYVGNGYGIIEYDGNSWRFIYTPTLSRVLSLTKSKENRIYAGASNDLGYLSPDSLGSMAYHSLLDSVAQEDRKFGNIRYIIETPQGIYFQSTTHLFRFNSQGIETWRPATQFNGIYSLYDTLHVNMKGTGLMRMRGDSLVPAPGGNFFADKQILNLYQRSTSSYLAFTSNHGMYICEEKQGSCTAFQPDLAEKLQKMRPYDVSVFPNGHIVIGTLSAGAVLLDANGTLLRILNEAGGLQSEMVRTTFVDQEGGLWLGLNNGISRISLNTPITYFDKKAGLIGAVNVIKRYKKQLYVATSHGVKVMSPAQGGRAPAFVPAPYGLESQCLALESTFNSLLAGCDGDVYDIEKNERIFTNIRNSNVLDLYHPASDSTLLFLGMNNGLALARFRDEAWQYEGKFDIKKTIRSFAEDSTGRIWMGTNSGQVIGLQMTDTLLSPIITRYGAEDGLPQQPIRVKKAANKIFALGAKHDTMFEVKATTLEAASLFEKSIKPSIILNLIEDETGKIWFFNDFAPGVAIPNTDGTYHYERSLLAISQLQMAYGMFTETNGPVWIGGPHGLVRLEPVKQEEAYFPAWIRQISTTNDSLLFGGHSLNNNLQRKWSANVKELRFTFGAPYFKGSTLIQYSTWLEGMDEKWSGWSLENTKDYTNLREGRYNFHVMARNSIGQLSEKASFSFEISAPWYRTHWAYLLWATLGCAAIGGITIGYNRVQMRNVAARNRMLEINVAERTEEIQQQKSTIEKAYEELTIINEKLTRSNHALEERTDQLRDALEANKEILGITAHDLKNPLGGIIGLAEVILYDATEGKGDQSIEENVPMLKGEAERMLQIVKDLLDSHRQDEGVALRKEKTILDEVVSTVLRWNGQQAQNKKITLVCNAKLDVLVEVDVMAIQRVLDNYVSNAIKYSPSGSRVCVQTNIVSCASGSQVRVAVQDEGPGLTESDKAKAFGKLQRLSAKPTGGEHSTGLGLFIVKKLVEAHDGEVGVESTYGEGAAFWFGLPLS